MKPETQEWIDKAEGDWKVATREMQSADPVWNVVCFLAQQCAEKYLKAFLEEHNIAFWKTHDLVVLFNSGGDLLSDLASLKPQLAHLSTFGIATRYPGAQKAMRLTWRWSRRRWTRQRRSCGTSRRGSCRKSGGRWRSWGKGWSIIRQPAIR